MDQQLTKSTADPQKICIHFTLEKIPKIGATADKIDS